MSDKRKSVTEIRKEITQKIATAIRDGVPPWRQPWAVNQHYGFPCNFGSGRCYSGINSLILMLFGSAKGFRSRHWGTHSGWLKIGGNVAQGEHGTSVTLYKHIPKRNRNTGKIEKDGKGREITIPILREFSVFNAEQIEAPSVEKLLELPVDELRRLVKLHVPVKQRPPGDADSGFLASVLRAAIINRLNRYGISCVVQNVDPDYTPAEQLILATGANIRHGGAVAMYTGKRGDTVRVPSKRSFESISDYYQTVFHELNHWVVNGGRIEIKGERSYAFLELVAEIGASFVLTHLHVPLAAKMLEKSQSYVAEWLKEMGNDPKYVFDAASLASKSADYLLAFVKQTKQHDAKQRVA